MKPVLESIVAAAVLGAACSAPASRQVTPSYDEFTRKLIALYADQDGDGRVDQWSYFDGNQVLRGEKDVDGDGRIDRWEYFDATGKLDRVGTSSLNDGVEDRWTWPSPAGAEGRIGHSRSRDRHIDRTEFMVDGALARAEEDTNRDGRVDRWDRYGGAVLRQVDFDTTFTRERPNHRAIYNARGEFERVEADPEFDGTFVTVTGVQPPPR
jgi:hypothetical protein